jgi:VanZ family protein
VNPELFRVLWMLTLNCNTMSSFTSLQAKVRSFWKPACWLVIILYLSLMPGDGLPRVPLFAIPHFDKLIHLGFYFVLTLLLIRPFSALTHRPYMYSLVTASLLSGLVEILQEKIAVLRHGDLYDFLANLTGILIALLFYRFLLLGKKIESYL